MDDAGVLCRTSSSSPEPSAGAYSSRLGLEEAVAPVFQSEEWSFTDDMELTKEVGEVLGVPNAKDMTVEVYVHHVRQALGVPNQPKPSTAADRARRIALPGR